MREATRLWEHHYFPNSISAIRIDFKAQQKSVRPKPAMKKPDLTLEAGIYRVILDNMGDGIAFLNRDDILVYINRAAEKAGHFSAESCLGCNILNVLSTHARKTSELVEGLLHGLKNSSRSFHNLIIEEKGNIFESNYYPVRNKDGSYLGTLIVTRDVTEKEKLKEETLALREQMQSEIGCGDMIGRSPTMLTIFQLVHAAAAVDSTIMITGESGTGKELVARAIHQHSSRKDQIMVKVNCAALPDSLLESELFGYDRGAFTGAIKDRKGKFEQAHGSTIFLDEVAEMPLTAQAKLLRVLQERTIERLGGSREISIDVRIIAATNRDLRREVVNGTFREDLFYRLNVIPISLPPLRERREDIQPLTQQFLNKFAERMHKPVLEIATDAKKALMEYPFPGNVRELENTIERAVALSLGGELRLVHLPVEYSKTMPAAPANKATSQSVSLASNVNQSEKIAIEKALHATGNRKGEAAQLLGISRKTLWEKTKGHGII